MSKFGADVLLYSASAFKDVMVCPARRHFGKLARAGEIQEDPAIAAVIGSAIHLGIEERLKYERNPMTVAKLYVQENLLDKYDAKAIDKKELLERTEIMDRCLRNFESHYLRIALDELTDPESQVELSLEVPWRKGWLVGKVDVALPHLYVDWKSSPAHPRAGQIDNELQHQLYYFMSAKLGLPTPEVFRYIYLYGFNEARKLEKIKSGPNAGKDRVVTDNDNPVWQFEFDTKPTPQTVNKTLSDKVIPLARVLEENIIYKNPSPSNCSKCKYRTVCPDFSLDTVTNAEHQDLLKCDTAPSSAA